MHDAAVALVGDAADQGVNGRRESERAGVGRHVVHPAVGDEDRACHAVRRHVGERCVERGEQAGAVGLAVGLAGLHHAHLDAGNALQALGHRRACGLGLGGAIAEILARALVDDDHRDRGERIAVLAGERGFASASTSSASAAVRSRAPRLRETSIRRAIAAATAAAAHTYSVGMRGAKLIPKFTPVLLFSRRQARARAASCPRTHSCPRFCSLSRLRGRAGEGAADLQLAPPPAVVSPPLPLPTLPRKRGRGLPRQCITARAAPAAPGRGPDRPCSCRSACTSRCSRRRGTRIRAGAARPAPAAASAGRPGGSPRRRRGRSR